MLSAVKHPHCTGFLACARNATSPVMLSEVKHPQLDSSLSLGMTKKYARHDKKKMLGMTEKSAQNDETECAEKSVRHDQSCHASAKRSIHIALDSSLSLGMTKKYARHDKEKMLGMTEKSAQNDETECTE